MKNQKGSSETTREITIQNSSSLVNHSHLSYSPSFIESETGKGGRGENKGMKKTSTSFYNWFIGFLEGDGSFFIRSNNTLGFEISQKTTDAQVLYYIKKNLGFGQVNHNSKNNISRFILSNRISSYLNFTNIVSLNDLRLIKRHTQYLNWILKLKSLISNPNQIPNDSSSHNLSFANPPASPPAVNCIRKLNAVALGQLMKNPNWEDSWLSGFIDAEGCFRISLDKKTNKYRLIFQITQDEIEILEKIKQLFGKKHRGSIIKDRNTYLLMISGKEARELIINYINKNPLKSQKRIAFMKWEKCHKLQLEMNEGNRERTLERIKELKESINKYS